MDFKVLYRKLKQVNCPHCHLVGSLILFGYLYGYKESGTERIRRGRRIFCSNRNRREGCGRTISLLNANFIKYFTITANTLWKFLKNIFHGHGKKAALKQTGYTCSTSTMYRILRKVKINQPHIRSCLHSSETFALKYSEKTPFNGTMADLLDTFPESPVKEFQFHFQTAFIPHKINPITIL